MKIKGLIAALIAVSFTANVAKAQEYKIPVENKKEGKITLEDFMDHLSVEGYSGNEIIFTKTGSGEEGDEENQVPERAKGLKPVYASGTDNSGMGLYVEKNGNEISVTCLLPITKRWEYKVKVPENFSVKVQSGCERSTEIEIKNIKNEIEIKTCQSIDLKNVTGPLVLSTISGNIDILFSSFSPDKPTSINSISGDIDITLPSKTALNINVNTVSGTVYTDFDLQATEKMKQIIGTKINSSINGGGAEFSLVSVSGNIYLRKGK